MATDQIIGEEDEEEDPPLVIDSEAVKSKVREIIKYQKYVYYSSSSSSSSSSSLSSSFASPRRHRRSSMSLLDLMKGGSTSLGRLFEMEHTSLRTYLNEYSGSPLVKPIFLWGSDTDHDDPWNPIKQAQIKSIIDCKNDGRQSTDQFSTTRVNRRQLTRKKSFRRLPRIRLWFFSGFRFGLRLRRLRVMICGRKF